MVWQVSTLVQIGAVNERVRVMEFPAKGVAEWIRVTSCAVTESIMMRLLGKTASALIGSIRPSASNIQNT